MELIIGNVEEIQGDYRRVFEIMLGQQLCENRHKSFVALDPDVLPDKPARRGAIEAINRFATKVFGNMERSGFLPAQADVVIDEAIEHLR